MGWADLIRAEIPDYSDRIGVYDMGDQHLDDDLLALFEETLAEATDTLVAAYGKGDDRGVAGAAHSIKGMGGMAGCPEISLLAESIERSIQDGERDTLARLVELLQVCRRDGVDGR